MLLYSAARNQDLVAQIKVGSVLSLSNATTVLLPTCTGHASEKSMQLHVTLNLDNKYSKLQVYNFSSNSQTDDNLLASFLDDLSEQRVEELIQNGNISNY